MSKKLKARKDLLITSVSIATIGVIGLGVNLFKKHDRAISEEVRQLAKDAGHSLENALDEIRTGLQNKTATQIEKSIDLLVEHAKKRLDRIASDVKTKLKESDERVKATGSHTQYAALS